ncbi:MAG: hypothetical protein E2P04_00380 [Acidobacteria bacterium]|nr:MAG: hypothetical protein E2P04_00380 [Acidobacteriota bacterium]
MKGWSMVAINRKRVFVGGLAGGLVWFLWSSLVNAVILGTHYQDLAGSGLLLEEQRYSFFVGAWALTLMVLSLIMAWMYAAARAALGAGPGTALKLGLVFGFVAGFPNNLAQATFSALPRVMPLWWMLDLWVGSVLAALVAASLYRDEEDDPQSGVMAS